MKLTQNTCFGGSCHVVLIGDFAYASTMHLSDAKISRPFFGYPKTSIRSRKRGDRERERKRKKERKKNILE